MNSTSLLIFIVTLFMVSSSSSISALVIRIPSGKVKCVTEDIAGPTSASSISVIIYRLLPATDDGGVPHHHNLTARVADPKGDPIHLAENVDSGQFAFMAEVPGPYTACFWSPVFRYGGEVEIDFEWKTGIASGTFGGVAKKEKINAVEAGLKNLEESVNLIYLEMRFLRQREEESWKIMGILSLLSLVICFGVAGFQIWHLKTFFVRHKIL